jgi:proteasome lid subunit RPN8/RPN11
MTFSIRATIRALAAPDHRISCSRRLWKHILEELKRRGEQCHEAGAFLLGVQRGGRREVTDTIFYDDLDPNAYETGACVLYGEAFATLWTLCRERDLTVVGDVHTHPRAAFQSHQDRTNPMVARTGHIAVIVPNFATAGAVAHSALGIYEYCGEHKWIDLSGYGAERFFYSGLWS